VIALFTLAALGGGFESARGCPNCKDAVADGAGETDRLQDGYSQSILLMIAMPLVLAGAGGTMIVRAVRRGAFPEL
jgi:hypothetical protein